MKKIRVLHYFNIMNRGGAETFTMNIFRQINREEFEFNFVCTNDAEGDYDKEIESLGGKKYVVKKYNKIRFITNLYNLYVFLKKDGPFDVIHIPVAFYSGVVAFVAKKAGIKKIIVHSHVSKIESKTLFRKFYIKCMKYLINKYADVKIACGEEAGKLLFNSLDNVVILNNGIDINEFNKKTENEKLIREEFNIDKDFVIGNVARFCEVKNHKFFIKLGKYIKDNKINAKILLVGDGKLRSCIEQQVIENKLENIVFFAGLRENVKDFLHIFNVFVMPSIDEGFPVSIVEALSCGVPCVLSYGIPKETNLIDGMVLFESLDSSIENWWNKIYSYNNFKISKEKIVSILTQKGFNIEEVTKKLEKIYKGR